jgi:hypothetical protein
MNLSIQQTLAIVAIISILVLMARAVIQKKPIDPTQVPSLLFATLSALGGVQILFKAATGVACQEFLGTEGSLALFIGGGFACWLGFKEINNFYKLP